MKQDNVIFVTHVNPLRAFSGIKYMCDALTDNGVVVDLWAIIPRDLMRETTGWKFGVRSFLDSWYGRVPKFRDLMIHLHIIILCIFVYDIIIFNDLKYFKSLVSIRKLFSKKKLIHYCTELFEENEVPLDYYKKNADIPDLIIDVEPNRGAIRKKWYSLSKDPLIILNTIPVKDIPIKKNTGCLTRLANMASLPNIPIILYTGGVFPGRGMETIVGSIAELSVDNFFLAFVYGDKKAKKQLIELCNNKLDMTRFKICDSVPRDELLSCSHEASVGIVYYPPSTSIGCKYAAPTKFFEYIACGIPVVSAPNDSLVEIYNQYQVGDYAVDESISSLKDAFERILTNADQLACIKKNSEQIFLNHLSYEVVAGNAINNILEFVKQ